MAGTTIRELAVDREAEPINPDIEEGVRGG